MERDSASTPYTLPGLGSVETGMGGRYCLCPFGSGVCACSAAEGEKSD